MAKAVLCQLWVKAPIATLLGTVQKHSRW